MKNKDVQMLELSEVLAEIQAFLDQEAQRNEEEGAMDLEALSDLPSVSSTRHCPLPASYGVTQFFLSREEGATGREMLEALPRDLFIVC